MCAIAVLEKSGLMLSSASQSVLCHILLNRNQVVPDSWSGRMKISCYIPLHRDLDQNGTGLMIYSSDNIVRNVVETIIRAVMMKCEEKGIKPFNSLRPTDAYIRQYNNHHWFR